MKFTMFSVIIPSLFLFGCAKAQLVLTNTAKSEVDCRTELGGESSSFTTTDGFTKETGTAGFLYISCQKKTAGDTNQIKVEVKINGDVSNSGTATDEFGIASASGSL